MNTATGKTNEAIEGTINTSDGKTNEAIEGTINTSDSSEVPHTNLI
jgi:hypothetical protein